MSYAELWLATKQGASLIKARRPLSVTVIPDAIKISFAQNDMGAGRNERGKSVAKIPAATTAKINMTENKTPTV